MVWTTRWMNDQEAPSLQYYALGAKNELMPTGQAIRAWGQIVQPVLVSTEGSDVATEVFASRSENGKEMTVWLLNRGSTNREIQLRVDGPLYTIARRCRFSGASDMERSPKWEALPDGHLDRNVYSDPALPPLSLTILSLHR